MTRKFYLDLASSGARMPIGADLVLRQHKNPESILRDGRRLGAVLAEAAERFAIPFAMPVMDLSLEKSALLGMLDIPADRQESFHFDQCPSDEMMDRVEQRLADPYDPRLRANIDAIAYARWQTKFIPVGMAIGPFSLMTKLLADPITPLYMAGTGVTADEDEEVRTIERVLELAVRIILRSVSGQIKAGAKAIFIAEPAANIAYISPNQLEAGSDIFDRYIIRCNQQIKSLLNAWGVDLMFHCCGELTDDMIRSFCQLDPAILSLGSSRRLWEDARLVPQRTVLYGNLPSKKFYSDVAAPVQEVERLTRELLSRMQRAGHPFILGSECDILSVPGCEKAIMSKVMAMLTCQHDDPIARAG